jgi:predicted NBD/HSP70 family sugar kinase
MASVIDSTRRAGPGASVKATGRLTPRPVANRGHDAGELRSYNARAILRALLLSPTGLTQAEIMYATRLARSTVSVVLNSLSGVVGSRRSRTTSRGRPQEVWFIEEEAAWIIGVDIGRSHVAVDLTNAFGISVGTQTYNCPDACLLPARAVSLAAEFVEILAADIQCANVAAISVGLPVAVDHATHTVSGRGSAWTGSEVKAAVSKLWPARQLPEILVDRAANLAAVAEAELGGGADAASFIYLRWSNTYSAGLMLDSKLWRGARGGAGEFGHLKVAVPDAVRDALNLPEIPDEDVEWPTCVRCGQIDCLDILASGPALAAAAGVVDLAALIGAANGPYGDLRSRALTVLQAAGQLVGQALGQVATLLDPDRIVIGGQVGTHGYDVVVAAIESGIALTAADFLAADTTFSQSALGDRAVLRGATLRLLPDEIADFLARRARIDRPPRTAVDRDEPSPEAHRT